MRDGAIGADRLDADQQSGSEPADQDLALSDARCGRVSGEAQRDRVLVSGEPLEARESIEHEGVVADQDVPVPSRV